MPKNTFNMNVQKQGRMKYLLITMVPPLAVMYLPMLLMQNGLIPPNRILGLSVFYGSMAGMMVISYFMIWKKNHIIEVRDNTLTEKSWRGPVITTVKTSQIAAFRRNFLGEIILLDKENRRLLCIESNMTNRDRFLEWLAAHNIESK